MAVVIALLLIGSSATVFVLMLAWQAETGASLEAAGLRAQWLADACADHALSEIRFTAGYAGSESLSFQNGSCTVQTVLATASSPFDVRTEGTSGPALSRTLVNADLSVDASGDPSGLTINQRTHVPEF